MNRMLLGLYIPCIFNILFPASDNNQVLGIATVYLADGGIILLVTVNIIALLESLSFLRRGAAFVLS